MKTYFDCWAEVAAALFSQALAGEPELAESLPKPLGAGSFGWAATLAGDVEGRFAVLLDGAVLETPLVGEGVDQKAGWKELLREAADAAAGELLAAHGQEVPGDELRGDRGGEPGLACLSTPLAATERGRFWCGTNCAQSMPGRALRPPQVPRRKQAFRKLRALARVRRAQGLTPGLELLLDVELEASLRFGAREMPLGEILDLGPGDVVELDRHVADPVDLIVGDKIVARGEVVLVNGNFGLRVTEVAAPRKRLESMRCLF